jgi:hypothetical protein
MGRLSTCSKDITALSNSSIELDMDGLYNSAKRSLQAAEEAFMTFLTGEKAADNRLPSRFSNITT